MRKLSYTVIFLVGGTGVLTWLSRGYAASWEPRLRAYLEQTASRLTKSQVHVDAITLTPTLKIRVVNPSAVNPTEPQDPIFQARFIDLSLSPIGLPRALYTKQYHEVIGRITVMDPRIHLSQKDIDSRRSPGAKTAKTPPWFTLAWEGGTFRWKDPRAPRGEWALYQSQGIYRIRGPRTSVMLKGSVDIAQDLRITYSQLGKRWSAQLQIAEGESQAVLRVLETLMKNPVLPASWTLNNRFSLQAEASSKTALPQGSPWLSYVDEATLSVQDLPPRVETIVAPAAKLSGTLAYKKRKITSDDLRFSGPWLSGQGDLEILFANKISAAPTDIKMSLPSGQLALWPYQNATIHLARTKDRWQLEPSTFSYLGGHVTARGTFHPTGHDVSITAQNIALRTIGQTPVLKALQGDLNVSCTLKGPPKSWLVSGAMWATHLGWGSNTVGEARGDFELTAQRFQAQAKSEDSRFRLSMVGRHNEKILEFTHAAVAFPSGASAEGEARVTKSNNALQGSWYASGVQFPKDISFLPIENLPFSGTASGQGKILGTVPKPVLKVSAQSPDVAFQGERVGPSSITLESGLGQLDIPTFQLGSGITGRFVGNRGRVDINDGSLGKWTFKQGVVQFEKYANSLDLSQVTLESKSGKLAGRAKLAWEVNSSATTLYSMEGTGQLTSVLAWQKWEMPFRFTGKHESGPAGRQGKIQVSAEALAGKLSGTYTLSGSSSNPTNQFEGRLDHARWQTFPFSTSILATWGQTGLKPLSLKGRLATGGEFDFTGELAPDLEAKGTLQLTGFQLKPLGESLRLPKPIEGLANATLAVSGPFARLQWHGRFDAAPLVYGTTSERPMRLEKLSMEMTLAPLDAEAHTHRLTLTQGEAKTAEELIRFQKGSTIDFTKEKEAALSLRMDLRNLKLGFFRLFGGLGIIGNCQFKPEGFAIQAKAESRSLFINDYQMEEGSLLVEYFDSVIKFSPAPGMPALVTGTIDFKNAPQVRFGELYLSGKDDQGVRITGELGPQRWDFKMAGRKLDVSILGELSGFPYPLSGSADVGVTAKGTPQHPHVEGKVALEQGRAFGMNFREGSADFVWENARIHFKELFLNDPGYYKLEGSGTFPLRQKNSTVPSAIPIDFAVRLKDANLGLIKSFSSEVISAKGPVEGDIQIKGTLDDPQLGGHIRVTNGEIVGAHYFRQLKNATLAIELNGNTIRVNEARGKSGQGEFRGWGTITLAGFAPSAYDMNLEVISKKGIEVVVPELAIPDSPLSKRFKFLTSESHGDLQGKVTFHGPAESPTFSGAATLSNGHFTFPPSRTRPPSTVIVDWFRRIYWDVTLNFRDGAWFENELVQASVSGSLALKGPSDLIAVDGGLDIAAGRISYLGLQFDVQQARYDIRSEQSGEKVVNTPYVRGVAESQIQAVDTVSGVTGGSPININDTITLNIPYAPVDEIKPRLSSASNPLMSQEKLLARVTRTDVENLTPQQRNYLYQKQLVSLIDSSLTTPLAQNVLKKTRLADRLRVQHVFDPSTVSADELSTPGSTPQQSSSVSLLANTKYSIEKDLSNRLSLGYGVRFVQSSQIDPDIQERKLDLISDIQLSYRWFRNVYVKGSFELPTANPSLIPDRRVTIEPRWRFGWWGNTNKEKVKK